MSFPSPTDKQARLIWQALTGLAMAALVALIAGLLLGLGKAIQFLSPVLWPVAVAGVLALLLNPVVDFFQRRGLSRTRAILAVFAAATLLLAGFFGLVVPQLVGEMRQFAERVPDSMSKLQDRLNEVVSHPPPFLEKFGKFFRRQPTDRETAAVHEMTNAPPGSLIVVNTGGTNFNAGFSTNTPPLFNLDEKALSSVQNWLTGALQKLGGWVFGQIGTWFGVLISLILVPVYAFYLLTEKYEIEKSWTNYLPVADSKFKTELVFFIRSLKNYLVAFFRGQVLVGLCEGVFYTIGFLIINLPYGLLLGAAAAVLTIIPFLGATVLCIVSFAVAVVQCADWQHPLGVLIVVVIVQSLEVFWLSPMIMRGRVGLHPAIIIFAVMTGTALLGGLLGGILAIPLAAMLKVMLSRYVWRRRDETEEEGAVKT